MLATALVPLKAMKIELRRRLSLRSTESCSGLPSVSGMKNANKDPPTLINANARSGIDGLPKIKSTLNAEERVWFKFLEFTCP